MLVAGELETQATIVSIFSMPPHEQFHGTYALKWAWDPNWARRQWLLAGALAVVDDPVFSGRRCHPKDTSKSYLTFQALVEYINERCCFGPFVDGALVLAKHVWVTECVSHPDDEWMHIEGNEAADVEAADVEM